MGKFLSKNFPISSEFVSVNFFLLTAAEIPILVSNALGRDARLSQVADLMSQRKCSRLPDYPLPVYNAAGSFVRGFPIICGGQNKKSERFRECFVHELMSYNKWRFLAKLKTKR